MAGKGLYVGDLVEHCGLDDACLDTEITRENFQKISPYLSQWKLLAPTLNISETEMKDIEDNSRLAEEKRPSFLQKWKQKMSMKATYRALVESLLGINRGDDARGVCQVLKASSANISPATLPRLEAGSLKQQITRLERNFECLVDSVEESFVKHHVSLKRIQNSVKHIHISFKLELGERFEEQASKILKTKSVGELFILLSRFWNYLNPGLLEYLVGRFGSKQDTVSLQMYLEDLKQFRSSFKLGEFIAECTAFNAKSCYCQKIVTIMGNDWEEQTLQEAEEYKKELATELQLQQFLAIFDIEVDMVKLEQFFKRNKVIKVFRDDICLFDWTKQPQVNAEIEEDEIDVATHNDKTNLEPSNTDPSEVIVATDDAAEKLRLSGDKPTIIKAGGNTIDARGELKTGTIISADVTHGSEPSSARLSSADEWEVIDTDIKLGGASSVGPLKEARVIGGEEKADAGLVSADASEVIFATDEKPKFNGAKASSVGPLEEATVKAGDASEVALADGAKRSKVGPFEETAVKAGGGAVGEVKSVIGGKAHTQTEAGEDVETDADSHDSETT